MWKILQFIGEQDLSIALTVSAASREKSFTPQKRFLNNAMNM